MSPSKDFNIDFQLCIRHLPKQKRIRGSIRVSLSVVECAAWEIIYGILNSNSDQCPKLSPNNELYIQPNKSAIICTAGPDANLRCRLPKQKQRPMLPPAKTLR